MDEEGLLLAIRREPASYLDKSIYADWLEEYGQTERAEFIREQLKGGELTMPSSQVAPPFLAAELAHLRKLVCEIATYRRGFVEAVTLPTTVFLAHAGELFQAAPLLAVTLLGRQPQQPAVYPGDWIWDVRPGYEEHANRLPTPLGPYMPGEQGLGDQAPQFGAGCGFWRYRSDSTARVAASTACVRFGRAAAHLPPSV